MSPSTSDTVDSESTALDHQEQLLTPATCLSETSSNTDAANSTNQHKLPKPTRRVTRASLKSVNAHVNDNEGVDEAHQTPLAAEASLSSSKDSSRSDDGPERRNLRSSRSSRSLANIEAATSEIPGGKDGSVLANHNEKGACSTTDVSQNSEGTQQKTPTTKDNTKSRRRSTRLSVLEKVKSMLHETSSILGKRSRDSKEKDSKSKSLDRRASLRPRNVSTEVPSGTPAPENPASKKRRISDATAVSSKKTTEKTPIQSPKPVLPIPYKRKKWLSHGLYAGQNTYSDFIFPVSKKRKDTAKKAPNSLLPLPNYTGANLLDFGRNFKLPFDIFSPMPRGQPKPDEWRKINKNVFIGDTGSIWKATMPSEQSTCLCTPESGCDENCQNRYMLYECDDTNCKLGEELCKNRSFSELRRRSKKGGKYNIGVEVLKTENRGYGVRSNRSFEPNQVIVEYTGEVITQEECERRMRTVYKHNECYYLMSFDQNMIIDATRGSIARFVNHSCEPNCNMEKWTVAGKPRIALFAGENGIMTGEELSYDYNFNPYSQKNVQECRCGTPSCRGVLGPRPRAPGKSGRLKENEAAKSKSKKSSATGSKRKQKSVLDESTSRLNKRRKIGTSSIKTGLKRVASKASQAIKPRKVKSQKREVNVKAGLAKLKNSKGKSTTAPTTNARTSSSRKKRSSPVRVSKQSNATPKRPSRQRGTARK